MVIRSNTLFLAPVLAGALTIVLLSAPALAAAPPDPCAVVNKSEAATALGSSVTGMKASANGPSRSCSIKGSGPYQSVIVTTYAWSSESEARAGYQSITAGAAMMGPPVAVRALGDEAQQSGGLVYVRRGAAAYVFNVIDGSVGTAKAAKALTVR